MKLKLVSVIILTYNRSALLMESIQSVLGQTYTDLELLVIDDGSTDDSQQLVSLLNDTRLKYFQFEHSGHTGRLKILPSRKPPENSSLSMIRTITGRKISWRSR